jgi:hypothetical protein
MSSQGMRIQSVRFSEAVWAEIQAEARLEGISASQFVRESAVARMYFARAQRGDEAAQQLIGSYEAARGQENGD